MTAWIIGLSIVGIFLVGLVAGMLYVSHEATEYETRIYGGEDDNLNS